MSESTTDTRSERRVIVEDPYSCSSIWPSGVTEAAGIADQVSGVSGRSVVLDKELSCLLLGFLAQEQLASIDFDAHQEEAIEYSMIVRPCPEIDEKYNRRLFSTQSQRVRDLLLQLLVVYDRVIVYSEFADDKWLEPEFVRGQSRMART